MELGLGGEMGLAAQASHWADMTQSQCSTAHCLDHLGHHNGKWLRWDLDMILLLLL